MKRKLLIAVAILLTGALSQAQDLDIKPSQQAQGLLESKNAMVDHATGLFHYKVPLYEIKSGDFTLPISLDYVAKGVKVNDQSGLVGYNWTLNTGGVVTRTIRGGIADEDINGILHNPLSETPTAAEIESVNKKERDGETDIFTASFNGQLVHFIIQKSVDNEKMIAIPLQKTNVKLESIQDSYHPNNIIGWIITDEQGNKYTFTQKELITNIAKSEWSTKSITSSWYITKIEPLNGKPIIYKYFEDVLPYGIQNNINIINHYPRTSILFNYGRSIIEHPFNFKKYQDDFNKCIDLARFYLDGFSLEMQLNNSMYDFINGQFVRNEFWESNLSAIKANSNIMGILCDFSKITGASSNAIQTLNELINMYQMEASTHALMAVDQFEYAKRLLIECLTEVVYLDEKEQFQGSSYSVRSPLLSQIEYDDKFIRFSYSGYVNSDKSIEEIDLLDIYKQKVRGVKINARDNMHKISYTDSKDVEYDNIYFEYYNLPSGKSYISDLWGYSKENEDPHDVEFTTSIKYFPNVDINCANENSLHKIVKKSGLGIELDYESNAINSSQYPFGDVFGGVRIKNIVFKDVNSKESSVVNYYYPEPGIYIFRSCTNEKQLNYGNFLDRIKYNSIVNEGNAWINLGNNGLYYPYVQEEFVGKGKTAYEFFVPINNILYNEYPFWLCAIPTAKASYDVNNKLINVMQYNYYDELNDEFEYTSNAVQTVVQVKPYEFYMNKGKIEQQFIAKGDIFLCEDGYGSYYINPFTHIYTPNVLPRTTAVLPDNQTYELHYGGRAILKEQVMYNFENSNTNIPGISDFTKTSQNYKKIEYLYDDISKNLLPTKIIQTNSDGSQNVEVIKRVVDIIDNSGILDTMKSKNMLGAILKTQKQVKNSTNNHMLIEEKVYSYGYNSVDNVKFMALNEIFTYKPEVPTSITLNNNLFSYDKSKYTSETVSYKYEKGNYLPTYFENINEKTLLGYDFGTKNIIMKSSNVNNNSAGAADYVRFEVLEPGFSQIAYIGFKSFYDKYSQLNFNNCSSKFREYTNTGVYETLIKIIKNIINGATEISFEEMGSLINSVATEKNVSDFSMIHIDEFENILPANTIEYKDFIDIRNSFYQLSMMTESDYNSIYLVPKNDVISEGEIKVTNVQPAKNYKLYVVAEGENYNSSVDYFITHSTNTAYKSITIPGSQTARLSVFDVNLSGYSNISSISVQYSNFIHYIALVPEDAEFEAMSYNADGTLFCKFNQNGQLERYEYDAAGRVIKIYDNDNNLLKEFTYNVVLQ